MVSWIAARKADNFIGARGETEGGFKWEERLGGTEAVYSQAALVLLEYLLPRLSQAADPGEPFISETFKEISLACNYVDQYLEGIGALSHPAFQEVRQKVSAYILCHIRRCRQGSDHSSDASFFLEVVDVGDETYGRSRDSTSLSFAYTLINHLLTNAEFLEKRYEWGYRQRGNNNHIENELAFQYLKNIAEGNPHITKPTRDEALSPEAAASAAITVQEEVRISRKKLWALIAAVFLAGCAVGIASQHIDCSGLVQVPPKK